MALGLRLGLWIYVGVDPKEEGQAMPEAQLGVGDRIEWIGDQVAVVCHPECCLSTESAVLFYEEWPNMAMDETVELVVLDLPIDEVVAIAQAESSPLEWARSIASDDQLYVGSGSWHPKVPRDGGGLNGQYNWGNWPTMLAVAKRIWVAAHKQSHEQERK